MVQERYECVCDVCQHSFASYQEASEHEKVPVVGEGLPRGFTFKRENGNFCVIRREATDMSFSQLDSNHRKLYACWTLPGYSNIEDNKYYCDTDPLEIPKNLEQMLLSDEEFRRVKEIFSRADRLQCPECINLSIMTNKLPEGYQHSVVKNTV